MDFGFASDTYMVYLGTGTPRCMRGDYPGSRQSVSGEFDVRSGKHEYIRQNRPCSISPPEK
eukprot:scaffold5610_cov237-Skeletonema_marinoi.AAC.7